MRFDAGTPPSEHAPPPGELVLDGSPQAGSVDLVSFSDLTIGLWEHTPGTSRDVEADEVVTVIGVGWRR